MLNFTMPPFVPVPYSGILIFMWIGFFLLCGMVLRSTFPLFRRYLIPSCIIGGTLGFIFQTTGVMSLIGLGIDNVLNQHIIYHIFNLTWIYIGLKVPVQSNNQSSLVKSAMAYFSMSNCVLFLAFAFVMIATIILGMVGLNNGPSTIGSLSLYALSAGSGQALTIASLWTAATSYMGLADFALASSAMGYPIAIVVGIFLINIIARKKKITIINNPSDEEASGFYNNEDAMPTAGKQTTLSTSIDVLAWHIGLGLTTYFLAYIIAIILYLLLPQPLKIFVWSVFFLLAASVGMCVRTIIAKINKGHLLSNDINNRISNTLIDVLVCATFISIQVGQIAQYIIPYFVSIFVSVTTISIGLWYFCSKLKEDGVELFSFFFGALIGTISSAFVLLRLLDPEGKSAIPVRVAVAGTISISTNMLLPAIMHIEPLYKMSPWFGVLGMLIVSGVLFIIAKKFQLPQTEKAWEPDIK